MRTVSRRASMLRPPLHVFAGLSGTGSAVCALPNPPRPSTVERSRFAAATPTQRESPGELYSLGHRPRQEAALVQPQGWVALRRCGVGVLPAHPRGSRVTAHGLANRGYRLDWRPWQRAWRAQGATSRPKPPRIPSGSRMIREFSRSSYGAANRGQLPRTPRA